MVSATLVTRAFSPLNAPVTISTIHPTSIPLVTAFGSKYVEALRDSLKRMESGTNRPTYTGSGSRQVNEMMDLLESGHKHRVQLMLEGLRKEIQDGIYD